MTTATDTLTVSAPSKADAPDVARRQWEPYFRVLRVISVTEAEIVAPELWGETEPGMPRWKVTAEVEVVRENA